MANDPSPNVRRTAAYQAASARPLACSRLVLAVFLGGTWGVSSADVATVTLRATVIEVQCTAQQRERIRACAPASERITQERAKRLVPAAADSPQAGEQRYEVRQDTGRVVLIRTVLY